MAQSTAGRSDGPARSEPVQVHVQPVPMFRPRDRWWLAAVVVAAVLPYLDSLQGAFVFDDFGLVTQNPYARPACRSSPGSPAPPRPARPIVRSRWSATA